MIKGKDVLIERLNASFIKIYCTDKGIIEDIYQHFRYEKPGFVKNRYTKFDGIIRLYSKAKSTLPYGCLQMLLVFCKEHGHTVDIDQEFRQDVSSLNEDALQEWIGTLKLSTNGIDIMPYDYQVKALATSIKLNRQLFLAATSSGKSCALYLMILYRLLHSKNDEKILVIVPTVDLVNQLASDFDDYSSKIEDYDMSDYIHKVYQGKSKTSDKPIVISTWQSMLEVAKTSPEAFQDYTTVFCDEVHQAQSDALQKILQLCTNAYARYGLTGTLHNNEISQMLCVSLFGPVMTLVTAKQLIDNGQATPLDITMLKLEYNQADRIEVSNLADWQKEKSFLMEHVGRDKILKSLVNSLSKVTLVLFDNIEHIESFRDSLDTKKKVYFITGQVDIDERTEIRQLIEKESTVIFLATMGTMSTGINIKNLHNLIFAKAGGKSIVQTLQSLGRLMRLNKNKKVAKIFDIIDDLEWNGSQNYTLRHAFERYKYYQDEGHPITIKKIVMKS